MSVFVGDGSCRGALQGDTDTDQRLSVLVRDRTADFKAAVFRNTPGGG